MHRCEIASCLSPCCPSTSLISALVHEGESQDAVVHSGDSPGHIAMRVRVSCLHGAKGVRGLLTFNTEPSKCRVSDVAAWVTCSQATPPEAIDLFHGGCLMNMHSELLEYDIMSAPTIDAILSYPDVQKKVDEHQYTPPGFNRKAYMVSEPILTNLLSIDNHMLDPQSGHSTEHDNKIKAALVMLKEHAASHQPYQSSISKFIHMFVLVVCLTRGVRINFYLDMGSATQCLKVSDIKNSLLVWLERTSLEMSLVLAATEVLVMYTTARYTPLDDDHDFQECGVPSELCAVVSLKEYMAQTHA